MWNTDSGAGGTLIPEQVERPFRPCGTPIPGKWNAPGREAVHAQAERVVEAEVGAEAVGAGDCPEPGNRRGHGESLPVPGAGGEADELAAGVGAGRRRGAHGAA